MAKVDRSILSTNDQQMGRIGDPDKLENSISHLADMIDNNDDGFDTHKSAVELDHPDQSVTEKKLADLSVSRRTIVKGSVGAEELDPALLELYSDIGVKAKLQEHEEILPLKANKQQEDWKPLVLQNGWVATGGVWDTPSYMKDEMGFVHFKGSINSGVTTKGTILFTVPMGYRPKSREFIGVITYGTSSLQMSNILIMENGNIIADNNLGNGAFGLGSIPPFQAVNVEV